MQSLLAEKRNAFVAHVLLEPGLHRKVPGLFVFRAPLAAEEGLGPFRLLVGICAALRNTILRVRIPGGVPDFGGSESFRTAPA